MYSTYRVPKQGTVQSNTLNENVTINLAGPARTARRITRASTGKPRRTRGRHPHLQSAIRADI